MRLRKENVLWNVLLGTGVFLLDSLKDRLSEGMNDFSERARDTYGEASRRVGRASDAIRGEDSSGFSSVAALLIGVGVGVGVGMLLAPASGEETRSNISNKVQEFGDRMRDKFSSERQSSSASGAYGT
ncbi:MAG: YtxH domain-containing protein [Acidobacteria bacterium]|nr:YtxH domain-containing protein [Acidobacteriota bacterium]